VLRDGGFVRDQLRPLLADAGFPSWDYRSSERLSDRGVADRLEHLVRDAGSLLVVATSGWWSPWTAFELRTARRHDIPVVAVRPDGARPCRRQTLRDQPVIVVGHDRAGRQELVDTLASTPTTQVTMQPP
jgi:hypothetical protein